jgi:hypothetical protein
MNGSFFSGRSRKDRAEKLVDAVLSKFNLVMGVSLVNSKAELLGGKIRPGYEKKFARQQSLDTDMWGSWYSLLLSIAGKMDDYGEKVEFLTIWREGYKTILVPIFSENAIISLAVDSSVDSHAIVTKVKSFLKESLRNELATG